MKFLVPATILLSLALPARSLFWQEFFVRCQIFGDTKACGFVSSRVCDIGSCGGEEVFPIPVAASDVPSAATVVGSDVPTPSAVASSFPVSGPFPFPGRDIEYSFVGHEFEGVDYLDFPDPPSTVVAVSLLPTFDCQVTVNGQQCLTCSYCGGDKYTVDCTNLPHGRLTFCESTEVDDFRNEAVSLFFPLTSSSPSAQTTGPAPRPTLVPTATAGPTSAITSAPVLSPVSSAPVLSPVSSAPNVAPVTSAPVVAPVTSAPVLAPVTSAPIVAPVTSAPSLSPVSSAPIVAPFTPTPVLSPVTSPPIVAGTLAPTMMVTAAGPSFSPTTSMPTYVGTVGTTATLTPTMATTASFSSLPSMINSTLAPTPSPSEPSAPVPTPIQSTLPSADPTGNPTPSPSISPSAGPTGNPTPSPSILPSAGPTEEPTPSPSRLQSSGPTHEPTMALPTEAPVAVTKPVPPGCASLDACFLENIKTGELTALSMDWRTAYTVRKGDRYTGFCEMGAEGNINVVDFTYDGASHKEYKKPWYMNGNGEDYVNKAEYLTTNCGSSKTVEVVGRIWKAECFRVTFVFESVCL